MVTTQSSTYLLFCLRRLLSSFDHVRGCFLVTISGIILIEELVSLHKTGFSATKHCHESSF